MRDAVSQTKLMMKFVHDENWSMPIPSLDQEDQEPGLRSAADKFLLAPLEVYTASSQRYGCQIQKLHPSMM